MLSLKGFHIFFIAVSILLGMFVGGWGVRQYLLNDQLGSLVLGAFFFRFGVHIACLRTQVHPQG